MGVVDSEADRFLRTTVLAKIGWLYLHHGWNVGWEADRVKRVGAAVADAFIGWRRGFKYAFKWWLLSRTDRKGCVCMARGFGGWRLMLFPGRRTDWRCLRDEKSSSTQGGDRELISRILPASRTQSCSAMPRKLWNLRTPRF
jgi:hypothetical protein